MNQDLLTQDEHDAVSRAGELAVLFYKIIGDGPNADSDKKEVELYIHALQNMVLSQAAARAYPELYRQLGKDIPKRSSDE